ncbi:MAG: DNA-binding response regulator [Alphaproteobacteria bacterium]|nr:DNA-binding response regulator [Alphaproteobacteria bacterium]
MRILLVEDDNMIGESLQKALKASYAVNWVRYVDAAQLSIRTENYDLMLLDLGLPDASGISFLQDLRKQGYTVPVLIITARDTVSDRVLGLDSGADDYLIKPFDLDELEARIRVLLRRKSDRREPLLSYGEISLDPATRELKYKEKSGVLSGRSFPLMQALLQRPGAILSLAQLEEQIYGWNEEIESNAVEVHIHSLRRKFGADLIVNVRGVGYTLRQKDQA